MQISIPLLPLHQQDGDLWVCEVFSVPHLIFWPCIKRFIRVYNVLRKVNIDNVNALKIERVCAEVHDLEHSNFFLILFVKTVWILIQINENEFCFMLIVGYLLMFPQQYKYLRFKGSLPLVVKWSATQAFYSVRNYIVVYYFLGKRLWFKDVMSGCVIKTLTTLFG